VDDVALEIDEANLALAIVRRKQGKTRKRLVMVAGAQACPSPFELDLFNRRHESSPSIVLYLKSTKRYLRYTTIAKTL